MSAIPNSKRGFGERSPGTRRIVFQSAREMADTLAAVLTNDGTSVPSSRPRARPERDPGEDVSSKRTVHARRPARWLLLPGLGLVAALGFAGGLSMAKVSGSTMGAKDSLVADAHHWQLCSR